jgi:hypothetical protein
MQPRITDITGTPKVNGNEISDNELPYLLEQGDYVQCESEESATIRVAADGYWYLPENEIGDIGMVESSYWYSRR